MLNVGDAILHFLGDTTDLDQVFARIPAQADAAMTAAAASTSQMGDAVQKINFELDATAENVPYAGEVIKDSMDKAKGSTHEAYGEAALLGELFGIHLPRHVRSFVAELPGVATALSAAFSATAILFLLEALVKGAEKIQEWAEHGEKVKEAWEKVDQTFFTASTHLQTEIDHSSEKIIEMTEGPVAALDFALQHLEHTSEMVFKEIEGFVAATVSAMKEDFGSFLNDEVFSPFGTQAQKDLDKFKTELSATMREAREAAPNNPFAEYAKGIEATSDKVISLQNKIESMKRAGADEKGMLDPMRAEITALDHINNLLQKGVDLQQQKDKELKQSRSDANASREASEAKQALDQQIASIDAWKVSVHAAYLQGQASSSDWKVSELQAADASKIAHEDYLQRIIEVYKRAGETLKAHEAEQQLVVLKTKDAAKAAEELAAAEQKRHDIGQKIVQENLRIAETNVDKTYAATAKAAEELVKAEEKLHKSETALREVNSANSVGYKEQEEAIKQLAAFHLITETQKANQLNALYAREEKSAVDALRRQLADEAREVTAAHNKLQAAEGNPFFSDAQILELRRNLALAQATVNQTETQIFKIHDDFSKKRLAEDKSVFGQAVAIATAAGNEELAIALKQHQADLIAIQDEIALTKARGQDTAALKLQQKEIEKTTNDLLKQVHQVNILRQAFSIFSAEFQKNAKTEETTAERMAQSFTTAAQGMESAISAAFSAMVSGTESAGQAIEKAMFKMIATIAEQWAKYYLAQAIADLAPGPTFNPAAAAAMFAAAAGLEALGGIMGGLGSASSSKTSSSSAATIAQNAGTTASTQPTSTVNVPKLSGGGLITHQTLAIVGESPSGGSRPEAVIPLSDHAALAGIAAAIAGHLPQMHGGGPIEITIAADIPHLLKKVTQQVSKGQARLLSSNSVRLTRRSV